MLLFCPWPCCWNNLHIPVNSVRAMSQAKEELGLVLKRPPMESSPFYGPLAVGVLQHQPQKLNVLTTGEPKSQRE